jgi:hypothetical protein
LFERQRYRFRQLGFAAARWAFDQDGFLHYAGKVNLPDRVVVNDVPRLCELCAQFVHGRKKHHISCSLTTGFVAVPVTSLVVFDLRDTAKNALGADPLRGQSQ